jgi:hypothetical protein
MASASRLTGWQRLGIVLSVLWLLGVGIKAFIDYDSVTNGGAAYGFAVLKDLATGREYSHMTRVDLVNRLYEEEVSKLMESASIVLGSVIKLPSGRKYTWDRTVRPTAAEYRALEAYDAKLNSTAPLPPKGEFDPDAYLAGVIPQDRAPVHAEPADKKVDLSAEFSLPPITTNNRVHVTMDIGSITQALVVPLSFFWAVFFTIRWVVAGFKSPPPTLNSPPKA